MNFPIVSGPGEAFVEQISSVQQLSLTQRSQLPIPYVPSSPTVVVRKMPFKSSFYKVQQSPSSIRSSEKNTDTFSMDILSEGSKYQFLQQLVFLLLGMILAAVPLAVISTFYVQEKNCIETTKMTIITAMTSSMTVTIVLPSECSSYTVINDSTRSINAGPGTFCDDTLISGWYRFVGNETLLATSDVSRDTCTTYYGGSFNGVMPSSPGTTTNGTLCLNRNGYLCANPGSGSLIRVTNCDGYYVYYLQTISFSNCRARYCTTN